MCECKGHNSGCWHQSGWWMFSVLCLFLLANRSTAASPQFPAHPLLTVTVAVVQVDPTAVASAESVPFTQAEVVEADENKAAASSLEAAITEQPVAPAVAEIDLDNSDDQLDSQLPTTSIADSSQSPHPLSVEPFSQMLPKDRPSWIDSEPDLESEVHRFVVASIPTSLKDELDSNLEATLVASLKTYVNQQFGTDADQLINDRLTAAFIQTNLVDENKSYVAEMQTGEGPVFQKWVMVEVTPEQRHQLQLWVSQQIQQQRLLPLGLILSGLLTSIGLSHLFLKRRSSLPDNLKATQGKFENQKFANRAVDAAVQLRAAEIPAKETHCRRSGRRRFGLLTALVVAVVLAWFVASPASSSSRRKVHRQKQNVELRFQTTSESPEGDCKAPEAKGKTLVL